jgi:ppGpp synthetase/RelA/SpoT-type nucleotidyltranferase
MLTKDDFLKKYNYSNELFEQAEVKWEDLKAIHSAYLRIRDDLERAAITIFNTLMKAPNVHSVRYRIKNPEHVIEKIIRKKIDNPALEITPLNYKSYLTDLIGLRALHLFKDEWEIIHNFIGETWEYKEMPTAYYREGDASELVAIFKHKNCETKEHEYGYRSIHYIIETKPAKQVHYAEIQVRTIFEEAWSEVDHSVRYPYEIKNPVLVQFLLILNRLAGGADEMGTFIKYLQKEMTQREIAFEEEKKRYDRTIQDLTKEIEKLHLKGDTAKSVQQNLNKLINPIPAETKAAIDKIMVRNQEAMRSYWTLWNSLQPFFSNHNFQRISANLDTKEIDKK